MEVRKGYKQTDIGLIPTDWEVKPLNEFLELLTDYDANGSFSDIGSNTNIFDSENYAWYVRATDLENKSDISNVKYVDETTYKYLKKSKLFGGEVLITKRGEIGKVYFFQMMTEHATLAPNLYLLKLNNSINAFYLFSFFKSELGQKSLIEKNASTTLGALYKDDVKSILIPVPPTHTEQTAIATALSDTDALITLLEKLIAKKRLIKQGAMQQLLTGKKRLPGFSEKWINKSISHIVGGNDNIIDGPFGSNLKNSDYVQEGIPVLQGLNITRDKFVWKEIRYISTEKAKSLYRSNARIGDLLSVKIGSVGYSAIIDNLDGNEYAIIPANLLRIRINNSTANSRFVYYILTSRFGKLSLKDLSGNTAQPAISLTGFRNLTFYIPHDIDEQAAIAQVLNDMDAEIDSLEQKLEKYNLIKQGMMQELLTGKTRLV